MGLFFLGWLFFSCISQPIWPQLSVLVQRRRGALEGRFQEYVSSNYSMDILLEGIRSFSSKGVFLKRGSCFSLGAALSRC